MQRLFDLLDRSESTLDTFSRGLTGRVFPCLLALLSASVVFAGGAHAEGGVDLGIGLGITVQDSDVDVDLDILSLRAHRWLGERWGLEGSLSVTEDGYADEDNLYLDLSAVYRITRNERFSTLLFGGVGALEYRAFRFGPAPFHVIDLGDDTVGTVHVGLAFQVRMGERLYFRPDLRHRRHLDVLGDTDDTSFDATLGFGWSF